MMIQQTLRDPRLFRRLARKIAFMRNCDDLITQAQRVQYFGAAWQQRADSQISAHLPFPSQTRSVNANDSFSLILPLRSSQIFSTDGYSRKSLKFRWSYLARTSR